MRYFPGPVVGTLLLAGIWAGPAHAAEASFTFTTLAGTSGTAIHSVGVASGNLRVYFGGQLTNLGPLSNFLGMAGCQ